MVHVIKQDGAIAVVAPETVGSVAVVDSLYIIAFPEDSDLGVAFFGANSEEHCIETMGLVLQSVEVEQGDFVSGKTAIEAAGGLVFLNGVQL